MLNFKHLCIAMSLFFAFGCGGKNDSDTSSTTAIEGTWKSSCLNEDGGYVIATMVNSGSTSTITYANYKEASCLTPFLKQEEVRQIADRGAGSIDKTRKIDFTCQSITATALTAEIVDAFNAPGAAFYGYSDWKINEPKDIAGKLQSKDAAPGDAAPNVGEVFYALVKIDGNQYTSGDSVSGDGKTDATRATTIDSQWVLTKQ